MLSILNRLAWVLSFCSAFVILIFLGIFFDVLDSYAFDDDSFFVWLILTTLLGMVFKKLVLSETRIEECCTAFEPANKSVLVNSSPPIPSLKDETLFLEKDNDDNEDYFSSKNTYPLVKDMQNMQEDSDVIPNTNSWGELDREEKEKEEMLKKEPNFLQKFFAENLLAKIGGILLFLGVLFLLQLVYSYIGPVAKIIIGFVIGFSVFGGGIWLDTKKLNKESQILLGTGILINYLVILSGRFLIASNIDNMLLSEGLTFFLLIFNTVFAVVTALVYQSPNLLFFALVISYFNPFLIGSKGATTPYTLTIYASTISLGVMFLSTFMKKEIKNFSWLLHMSLLGSNILILLAPFNSVNTWIFKLVFMGLVSLGIIFTAYYNQQYKYLFSYFLASYLFFIILLIAGDVQIHHFLNHSLAFMFYIAYLLIITIFLVLAIIATSFNFIIYLLILPLLIILSLIFCAGFSISLAVSLLFAMVMIYLLIYSFLADEISIIVQYLFFTVLAGFIITANAILGNHLMLLSTEVLTLNQAITIVVTSFSFMLSSYYLANKKELSYLYTIGTIGTIAMLLPIINREGDLIALSVVSIIIFLLINIMQPFINQNLIQTKIYNLVIGLVLGVLFGAGEIYYFGEKYFPGTSLGLGFLGLAVLYFILSYMMFQKIDNNEEQVKSEAKLTLTNAIYTLVGISISLFSLAIAFVFSKHSEVVSAIWLFEASLMFFFYHSIKDEKIYIAGIILMIIGFFKLTNIIPLIKAKEFLSLIPISIILMSLIANLKFLDFKKSNREIHDIIHILCVMVVILILLKIIPSTGHGWSIFGVAIFTLIPAFIYSYFNSGIIKNVFIVGLISFFIYQITEQDLIYYRLDQDKLVYLKVLQYLSTAILAGSVIIYNKFLKIAIKKDKDISNRSLIVLNTVFAGYLFIITTQYIYNLFADNEFIITIYWGTMAFVFLVYGIANNFIKFRTIGLYILSLAVGKILVYDIWSGLDNAVLRVFALMLVGILMIVISTFYSKKYGGQLKGEFSWQNFLL